MEEKTMEESTAKAEPAGTITMRAANTTYVIGIHFSKKSKETLGDKLIRLICEDMKTDELQNENIV